MCWWFWQVPQGSALCCFRFWGQVPKVLEGSGVCWCRFWRQVPEAGSGRFRRVPLCVALGSGPKFRKVREGSGVCWCRFRRQVPEGSAGFRFVLL